MAKIRISDIIESVKQSAKKRLTAENSTNLEALPIIDKFLAKCCIIPTLSGNTFDGPRSVRAARVYTTYQAYCESQGENPVNQTTFSVRVMNRYRGLGIERTDVLCNGERVEIYKGLMLKDEEPEQTESVAQQPQQPSESSESSNFPTHYTKFIHLCHEFFKDGPMHTAKPKFVKRAKRVFPVKSGTTIYEKMNAALAEMAHHEINGFRVCGKEDSYYLKNVGAELEPDTDDLIEL